MKIVIILEVPYDESFELAVKIRDLLRESSGHIVMFEISDPEMSHP